MSLDVTEFGITPVNPDDTFKYRCTLCGDCCRYVKDAIMVESYDLFNLARFFKTDMQSVILQYTNTAFLSRCFPIFVLKTTAPSDSCVFLKESRCSIQSVKPRTCRTYPLGFGPDDDMKGIFQSFIVSKKPHHFIGDEIRVKDWMDANLSQEARAFIIADYRETAELAMLLRKIDERHDDSIIKLVVFFKYINFDTAIDFSGQYARNNTILKSELRKLVK